MKHRNFISGGQNLFQHLLKHYYSDYDRDISICRMITTLSIYTKHTCISVVMYEIFTFSVVKQIRFHCVNEGFRMSAYGTKFK